jgi:hypothetical protein
MTTTPKYPVGQTHTLHHHTITSNTSDIPVKIHCRTPHAPTHRDSVGRIGRSRITRQRVNIQYLGIGIHYPC